MEAGVDNISPITGRMLREDGTIINVADAIKQIRDGVKTKYQTGSANAANTCTIPASTGQTARVWGYVVKVITATNASAIDISITVNGAISYYDSIPASAGIGYSKTVMFPSPIQSAAVGTLISVYATAPGTGSATIISVLYDYI